MEDMVEQQLWHDATHADPDSSSSDAGGGSGSSSLAAGAADDRGIAAWELNMKSLKTAAYDLGRLSNEVRCYHTRTSGPRVQSADAPAKSALHQSALHTALALNYFKAYMPCGVFCDHVHL